MRIAAVVTAAARFGTTCSSKNLTGFSLLPSGAPAARCPERTRIWECGRTTYADRGGSCPATTGDLALGSGQHRRDVFGLLLRYGHVDRDPGHDRHGQGGKQDERDTSQDDHHLEHFPRLRNAPARHLSVPGGGTSCYGQYMASPKAASGSITVRVRAAQNQPMRVNWRCCLPAPRSCRSSSA